MLKDHVLSLEPIRNHLYLPSGISEELTVFRYDVEAWRLLLTSHKMEELLRVL